MESLQLSKTPGDIDLYRQRIEQLYIYEQKPLQEVMEILRGEGCLASKNMYLKRLASWGLKKNMKHIPVSEIHNKTVGQMKISRARRIPGNSRSKGNTLTMTQRNIWNRLVQVRLQTQYLQPFATPLTYKLAEDVLYLTKTHIVLEIFTEYSTSTITPSGETIKEIIPHSLRHTPTERATSAAFQYAMTNGIEALAEGRTAIGIASLEQAFRLAKNISQLDKWVDMDYLIRILITAAVHNKQDVSQMMMSHFASMWSVVYGANHPRVIWARSLCKLIEDGALGFLLSLARSYADALDESVGVQDPWSLSYKIQEFEHIFRLRNDPCAVGDATLMYNKIMENIINSYPILTFDCKYVFAQACMKFEAWNTAELILGDMPAFLDYFLEGGDREKPNQLDPQPIVVLVLATLLGRVLTGKGQYSKAKTIYRKAIEMGDRLLTPDDPSVIEASSYLSACLIAEKHDDEANEILLKVEERLDEFKL